MKKRLLAILLALSMVLTLLPGAALAAEGETPQEIETYSDIFTTAADVPSFFDVTGTTATSISNFTTFGDQLTSGSNARIVYDALVAAKSGTAIREGTAITASVTLPESVDTSNKGDVSTVLSSIASDAVAAFNRDYPEIFWTNGLEVNASWNGRSASLNVTLPLACNWKNSTRTVTNDEGIVNSKVTEIANAAKAASADKHGQLAYVHDWLVTNNAYNTTAANGGTSYSQNADYTPWTPLSALTGDNTLSPVCEGYSRAFKLVCNELGIPCVLVSGTGITTSGSGPHMWNYVKLDSGWYAVDVTWDDPTGASESANISREWFLKGSSKFAETNHKPESNNYLSNGHMAFAYPVLSNTDYAVKRAPTCAAPANVTATYGQTLGNITLTNPASNTAGAWTWENSNQSVGDVTGSPRTFKAIFTPTDTTTYNTVTGIDVPVTVNAKSIPVTVAAIPDQPYTGSAITPDVTVTGDGITLTKDTDYTVSYSNNTGVGTATVTVSPVSGSNYTFTAVDKSFTITAGAQQTLTISSATSMTYGGTLTLTTTGGSGNGAVTYAVTGGTGTATINGDQLKATQVGTVTVTATKAAEGNYTAATSAPVTITIDRADPTITVNTPITVVKDAASNLNAVIKGVGDEAIASPALTYSSGDVSKVTVTADGAVTGLAATTTPVTVTVSFAGNQNYNAKTATVAVTVTEKQLATVNFADAASKTYVVSGYPLGNQFTEATVTVPAGETGSIKYQYGGQTYDNLSGLPNVTNAGIYKVTAVYEDDTYYGAKEASFTITKADQATLAVSSGNTMTYGGTLALTTTGGNGTGAVTYAVTDGTGSATINGSTLTATGVGTVTVTATKAADSNYNAATSAAVTITIDKATAPANQTQTVQVVTAATSGEAVLVSPTVTGTFGTKTYTVGDVTDADSILTGTPAVDAAGKLTFSLAADLADKEGKTATIPVTVSSTNYENYTVTVTVEVVAKQAQTAPAAPVLTYALNADRATYTVTIPAVAGAEYSFDGTNWSDTNVKADVAPNTAVTGYIRMKETATHLASPSASGSVTTPGIPTLTPEAAPAAGSYSGDVTVTLTCGDADAAIFYTTDGSVPSLTAAGTTQRYTGPFTVTPPATVNAFAIASGKTRSEVLTVVYAKQAIETPIVPPYIPDTPSGGGSSSGGSSSGGSQTPSVPSEPSVTPNPSGQAVTAAPKAEVSGSTASAAVSNATGRELVDQAVRNGSETVVIAPAVTGSVSRTEVSIPSGVVGDIAGETGAALKVETPAASVTIPNEALPALAGRGGEVTVSAGRDNGMISLEITAGGRTVETVSGGVTVTVSEPGCTAGTVAMLVKEDGSSEIVRQSVADASSGTVTVPLDGSARIVLVDNSKQFSDVTASSWASDAVAFVSSRELMNGTGEGSFTPNAPMTRGMLAVVLHNLEGNPDGSVSAAFSDVTGGWYAEAVSWAAGRDIITGYAGGEFRPDGEITREQLAVMLYRYAGSPAVSGSSLPFSDAASVSGYARDAIAWASANGIMNGKGGGVLDPQGGATRAEVAQMLMNFVASLSK